MAPAVTTGVGTADSGAGAGATAAGGATVGGATDAEEAGFCWSVWQPVMNAKTPATAQTRRV
jgi:hypothetical protein